jgi:hypothetical protein
LISGVSAPEEPETWALQPDALNAKNRKHPKKIPPNLAKINRLFLITALEIISRGPYSVA